MNSEEPPYRGAAQRQNPVQHLEARITELENRLRELRQPRDAEFSEEELRAYLKVRNAIGRDPAGCIDESMAARLYPCFTTLGLCGPTPTCWPPDPFCIRCHCRGCSHESSCGPCSHEFGAAGGIGRFGGLGG